MTTDQTTRIVADLRDYQARHMHGLDAGCRACTLLAEAADLLLAQQGALETLPPSLRASLDLFHEDPATWHAEWTRKHEFGVKLIQRAEAADARCAVLEGAIRALVEEWEVEAEQLPPHSEDKAVRVRHHAVSRCASQLAAVLASPARDAIDLLP